MKQRQYRFLQICTMGELTTNQIYILRRTVQSAHVMAELAKLEHKMKRLNQWVQAYAKMYYPTGEQ